jgi:AcrR family transcriptional regulator
MEAGFAAASMSEIAARVGGSKGTLYNYFKSKEELFEAYIQRFCAFQQEAMDDLLSRRGDVRETLRDVGLSFLRFSLSETALRNLAMVAAESRRAPISWPPPRLRGGCALAIPSARPTNSSVSVRIGCSRPAFATS